MSTIDSSKIELIRKHLQEEYQGFPIPEKSYLILRISRTGSNMLATHLQKIEFGCPFEGFHFNHAMLQRRHGWEIDFNDPAAYMKQVINAQMVNGVFGTKFNWSQLQNFFATARKLTNTQWPDLTDIELFEIFFPNTKFIYMKRFDKVKQAVSFFKAKQTGIWMQAADEDEEYKKYLLPPVYDRAGIEGSLEQLLSRDTAWDNFLKKNQLDFLELWYEELAKDFSNEMLRVYDYLGVEKNAHPTPVLKKQSNVKSQDWAKRFIEETPWLQEEYISKALSEGDFRTAFIHRSMMIINEKETASWNAMPANKFKGLRKLMFRIKRKIQSLGPK